MIIKSPEVIFLDFLPESRKKLEIKMSFSSLPNELIFQTLRDIAVEDLPSFCQSNSLYRNACSDPYFWDQKFAHEGLPILGKGYDFSSWLAVYRSSLFSKTYADRFVQEFISEGGKETYINFLPEQVKDPQILFLGDALPAEIVKFLTYPGMLHSRIS